MLQILARVDDAVRRVEYHLLWTLLGIIAATLLAAVFFRYVLASPFTWTEELVTILFTWMVFIGASACFASHQHIRVDSLPRIAPLPVRVALGILSVLACFLILGICVRYGLLYAQRVANDRTPMMNLSFSVVALALPVTSVAAMLHILRETLSSGPERVLMSTMEMAEDEPGAPL
ncbi:MULTISPECIES: TRAP transporter small permease [Chelatococcus]|uniref:TRAP transporter small permease protein n=1 Tax=Chelatococcus caeni TaxID=1348468 RepID=A0A840C1I5_9HYPH|nr:MULTISPECIES: TRAP transporter small permease [Chelatococcus]ALA16888.1 C4-dicarboxylate ABC transporter permease [Chelatococcus sp. CO-6]MBB4017518.1 TRAP-type C4-dicarboxylate transport system permease small subunit [Chelatococcus caeni]